MTGMRTALRYTFICGNGLWHRFSSLVLVLLLLLVILIDPCSSTSMSTITRRVLP